jgi:phospholipid:diacylglycerol acyltransferase
VWGNLTHAPDDQPDDRDHTHGALVAFRNSFASALRDDFGYEEVSNMSASEASSWILERTPSTFQVSEFTVCKLSISNLPMQKMIATNFSFGIERDGSALERNDQDHTKWSNPLEVR